MHTRDDFSTTILSTVGRVPNRERCVCMEISRRCYTKGVILVVCVPVPLENIRSEIRRGCVILSPSCHGTENVTGLHDVLRTCTMGNSQQGVRCPTCLRRFSKRTQATTSEYRVESSASSSQRPVEDTEVREMPRPTLQPQPQSQPIRTFSRPRTDYDLL